MTCGILAQAPCRAVSAPMTTIILSSGKRRANVVSSVRFPRLSRLILAALAALVLWAVFDLRGPCSHDLRAFQPDEVGSLDAAMWRSYYDHRQLRLFSQLATLLRTQYGLPLLRSYVVAFHAARAAVVFQRGRTRADYEHALPDLRSFYGAIDRVSLQHFDVERAARLELEWWIIHRERAAHAPGDLPRALAELQSAIYHEPADRFVEHARERADAMLRRDAAAGRREEPDWAEIDRELKHSWTLLWAAVNHR